MHATNMINLKDTMLNEKGQTLSDSIYMKSLEYSNLQRQKVEWWLSRAWGRRRMGSDRYRVSVWKDEKSSEDRWW